MSTLAEKRVYSETVDATSVYVATGIGVARIDVAEDRVGDVGIEHRCRAFDLAAWDGRLAVATDEDVITSIDGYETKGIGPAVAVSYSLAGDALLAASPDGEISRLSIDETGGEWISLGTVDGVTAMDGDLIGTGTDVFQVERDGLVSLAFTAVSEDVTGRNDGTERAVEADRNDETGRDIAADQNDETGRSITADRTVPIVRDVTAADRPLVATDAGLYERREGRWNRVLDGSFAVVSESDGDAGDRPQTHAATGSTLNARSGEDWRSVELPVESTVVDVAYGPDAVYVATTDSFLANAGDGWRSRTLGLPDASALGVP